MAPARPDRTLPLDRAEALERIGGDEAFLDELLALYDEEYAAKSAAITSALEAGDLDQVRSLGHGLKGASANLSLPGLREAAQAIETAGREKNGPAAGTALQRLEEEYKALKAFLG
ncbi:MAG: Hpt domain-containing protein [Candidatus Aminicenantes bacterium]|nr:Hpt domain-containing protein [Candidatus Aminicenantes bacterium]